MAYPLPTNVESMVDYIIWANQQASELPIKLFLLAIWIIATTWLFYAGKETEALLVSTTVVFILAMLFQLLGMIAIGTILMIVVLLGILAVVTWMVNR